MKIKINNEDELYNSFDKFEEINLTIGSFSIWESANSWLLQSN